MTKTRSLPKNLAGIVELLELEQPHIVTLPMLEGYAVQSGAKVSSASEFRRVAYWLQDLGWLGSLRSRGAWEFIPGSRAGAFGSGDQFIEFRAQATINPNWPGVLAMESAALILGLNQRFPDVSVVDLPAGYVLPKALDDWRVARLAIPECGCTSIDGVRTWNATGLLAGIAQRPTGYKDLAGLAQWLPELPKMIDLDVLTTCISDSPLSVWQRAAYLLIQAGDAKSAERLLEIKKPEQMIWYGATRKGGAFDPITRVNDADLNKYLGEVVAV